MSEIIEVRVPDVGDTDGVEVVEILVAAGDRVAAEDGLVVLSSDKASMDLPSPAAGTVQEIKVAEGSEVAEGDLVALLEVEAAGSESAAPEQGAADETPSAKETAVEGTAAEGTATRGGERETGARKGPPGKRLVVIGSGPGGYSAAFRAADLGMEVTLVERYPILGGVCLNVGCIPSKALLHAAEVIDAAARMSEHGIKFGAPEVDLDALRGWKDKVVGQLTGGLAKMAKQRKVKVVQGTGRFTGPNRLAVDQTDEGEEGGNATEVDFDQAIIATGSRVVRLPFIPWDDPRVMDSTGALELEEIPGRLLVIGGGIIGLEMACVYEALGAEITVVELMDGLIPEADRDLLRPLERRIKKSYKAIYTATELTALEPTDDGLLARFEGDKAPESALFDRALVAVGRRPNGDLVAAEAAGVEVDERGFVPTDNRLRTNVEHIFAIGDVTKPPMLAHKAVHEGKVAAEVAAGEKSAFDARVIPSVAYTNPEIAWVGLTENQADEQGIAYDKGAFPWTASGRALAMGVEMGTTKLLVDPETRRILGAGATGPHAGDLISEAALAIEMGCEPADIGLTIHPHPTLSETVAFAAEVLDGTITDLYVPKKKGRKKKG